MNKYIAIVATIGAGKTSAAEYFTKKGYIHYKLSEAIIDEANRRKLDTKDRTTLQDLGDLMRKKGGVDVLAKIALKKIRKNKGHPFVIESIRNHNELITLKNKLKHNLIILAIDAPIKIRYKRVISRKGQYKERKISFQEFQKINKRDLGKNNLENEQNVYKCMKMADYKIQNKSTLQKLKSELDKFYLSRILT